MLVGAGEHLERLARLPRIIHLVIVGAQLRGGGNLLLQKLLAHQLRETPAAPGVDDYLAAALIHRIAHLEVRLHGVLRLLLVLERDEDMAVAAQISVARDLARRDTPAAREELRLRLGSLDAEVVLLQIPALRAGWRLLQHHKAKALLRLGDEQVAVQLAWTDVLLVELVRDVRAPKVLDGVHLRRKWEAQLIDASLALVGVIAWARDVAVGPVGVRDDR